jgi:hypothetical protein
MVTAGRTETLILSYILIGCCPSVVAGCGRGHVAAGGGAGTTVGTPRLAAGSACDRGLLTASQVAAALGDPIDGSSPIPGDPESCAFAASGGTTITVTVRRGLGRVTVDSWRRGRMPAPAQSMAGVGDEAVWVGVLREVIAERHDLLCDIQATGPLRNAGAAAGPERDRLGALCRRIFDAADALHPSGPGADPAR